MEEALHRFYLHRAAERGVAGHLRLQGSLLLALYTIMDLKRKARWNWILSIRKIDT